MGAVFSCINAFFSKNNNHIPAHSAVASPLSETVQYDAKSRIMAELNKDRKNTLDLLLITLFIGITLKFKDHKNDPKYILNAQYAQNLVNLKLHIDHLIKDLEKLGLIKQNTNLEFISLNKTDIFSLYEELKKEDIIELRTLAKQNLLNILQIKNKAIYISSYLIIGERIISSMIDEKCDEKCEEKCEENNFSRQHLLFTPFYIAIKVFDYILETLKYIIRKTIAFIPHPITTPHYTTAKPQQKTNFNPYLNIKYKCGDSLSKLIMEMLFEKPEKVVKKHISDRKAYIFSLQHS